MVKKKESNIVRVGPVKGKDGKIFPVLYVKDGTEIKDLDPKELKKYLKEFKDCFGEL